MGPSTVGLWMYKPAFHFMISCENLVGTLQQFNSGPLDGGLYQMFTPFTVLRL